MKFKEVILNLKKIEMLNAVINIWNLLLPGKDPGRTFLKKKYFKGFRNIHV